MNIDQDLNKIAKKYRSRGYTVVVQPGPNDLPDFAKDFKVEIVARRKTGGVLVSVKKDQHNLEVDRELPRYAEAVEKEPDWRFDVVVLGFESQPRPIEELAKEPSEEDIRRDLEKVPLMLQMGLLPQAFITAWALLETAMRLRLRAKGEEAGWGSSPRTMLNELYSDGLLQSSVFRDLEGLYKARNAIVHGFAPPIIEDRAVHFLTETAQKFLNESRVATSAAT